MNVPLDFAVCGGIAMLLHGFVRFTKDIDLLIRFEDLDRVLAAAKTLGFEFQTRTMSFATGTPNEIKIHRTNKVSGVEYLSLDLVLVSEILEDVWEERELFSWHGRMLPVVSAKGLVKMKRLANRDQDLLDIKTLGFKDDPPGFPS
ncbi:MAG: hypothetical protein K8T89_23435 [Planctomycetes bacterium]|nr:hypothetical protein [Planctomycetota bacterium]